jgi:transposase
MTTVNCGGTQAPIHHMKAYLLDLREKVLSIYHYQEGLERQLAKRSTIMLRFVGELIARFRRTGSYPA